jgi:hypothetical protein
MNIEDIILAINNAKCTKVSVDAEVGKSLRMDAVVGGQLLQYNDPNDIVQSVTSNGKDEIYIDTTKHSLVGQNT